MGTTKKYWNGLSELHNTEDFVANSENEFPQEVTVDEFLNEDAIKESSTNRRDFLKFLGFSVAAATLAACETPVTKVIPYVNKPENVTPGMPTWYASTYYDGNSYASILVKTREGRPILIKGNKKGLTKGTANPQIVASVLSLYDSERLKSPLINNQSTKNWSKLDGLIQNELSKADGNMTLVTSTIISPTTQLVIDEFTRKYNANHIQYDAVSYSGIRKAALHTWGKEIIPNLDFSKAKTIVSISADFFNSWLLPTEFMCGYLKRRKPDGDWMSKHYQFETTMSGAGSNADVRGMIKPSQQVQVAAAILKGIVGSEVPGVSIDLSEETSKKVKEAVKSLKKSKGESLVVCGSNDVGVQLIVNAINIQLGALNHTVNINDTINLFKSEDDKMTELVSNVIAGKGPKAILFYDTNPVYTLSNGKEFGLALKNIETTISFALYKDETASNCKFICPSTHALESWNDYNPIKSHYSLAQPSIRPLYNSRSFQESLMIWSDLNISHVGKDSQFFYNKIRSTWNQYGYNSRAKDEYGSFENFWSTSLHNASIDNDVEILPSSEGNVDLSLVKDNISIYSGNEFEISLYQNSGIGIGLQTSNPWLQEMPDPITKITWDNYILMAPSDMDKRNYNPFINQRKKADLATINANGVELTLPVIAQPGQMPGTISIALGYGRGENGEKIGKAAFHTKPYGGFEGGDNGGRHAIGKNAYRLATDGFEGLEGSLIKTGGKYPIAKTQTSSTSMARHSIVRETTLEIYKHKSKDVYNPPHVLHTRDGEVPVSEFDMWKSHPVEGVGHRWGMTIDLNTCIGCGTCLISCTAENNVPVVGKDEVRRGREMHWLRLDRYYVSDQEAAVGQRKDSHSFSYSEAEKASQNPSVVFMPMMCQHCNHAPCETVCPVAATTHSNEGLNMMAYNRCIGTRYCANNCPYKVRRFNWFNYPSYKKFTEVNPAQDDIGRMVLNPDVVVRTRGVMEKCSMCIQNIQAGKLKAKVEGVPLSDEHISAVCGDSCPTDAIIFGDWNDPNSAIRKSSEGKRSYQVLEEIGVKPNIWYKVKVRNNDNELLNELAEGGNHGGGHHNDDNKENKGHH